MIEGLPDVGLHVVLPAWGDGRALVRAKRGFRFRRHGLGLSGTLDKGFIKSKIMRRSAIDQSMYVFDFGDGCWSVDTKSYSSIPITERAHG